MQDGDADDTDFEELYGRWDPSLLDAVMIDKDRFALLLGGVRYDDPYTIILTHDGRQQQPWSRFDVRRELRSLRVAEPGETAVHPADYVILSLSGDIYYIGQDLVQTTIPGTQTEDPEGEETYSYGLVWTGTEYLVAGEWGVLRAGLGRDWRDEAPEIPEQYPYAQPSWRIIGTDRT